MWEGSRDKTAIAAQIADCRGVVEAKIQRSMVEYNRLNRYIANVPDSLTRQIMALRFVNGMSWNQVAMCVEAEGIQRMGEDLVNRYLKKS